MCENLETVSLRICQDGHANALALNNDNSKIAVAGRSLLKVYSIGNDGFSEVYNMRGGKNQNLSYSSNDVAWSHANPNILATAATNGVISLWDLSKFGRQKQLLLYNEHTRTAHTVVFHTEPNLLLSGSQDGTIKCFDIRVEKSVYTYFSNSEAVRDVKFNPQNSNIFSAVSEDGHVHLWDLRKNDKYLASFTAHSGPIYTCDWHPKKSWLATGSRDKQIKVWNMESKASLEYTINTIAVVGRVRWRPERCYHIASCALVVDYSIHVWDIRRPFIPFASFNEHTNVTTGIAWKGSDSHCLLSTSKDSTIYKHAFKDASRPALKANAQGASLGRRGDISFAQKKSKSIAPITTAQIVKTGSLISRQTSIMGGEQFHKAQSDMYQFLLKSSFTGYTEDDSNMVQLKEHECFIGCAKELIMTGQKLVDICEHNAIISKKYGKHNATTLWNFIKVLYGTNDFSKQLNEHRNSFSTQKNAHAARRLPTQNASTLNHDTIHKEMAEVSGNEDEADIEAQETDLNSAGENYPPCSSVILSESQILTEITFDNFDLLRNGFIYVGPTDFTQALSFPDTALHTDVVQAARPQLDLKAENREKSPPPNIPSIIKVTNVPRVPMWEPHKFIADSIILQSDMGDAQTALIVLIAMGEARKLLPIDDTLIEHCFQIYIDQLHRYQLWNEACAIINLSWIRSVRELNQQSTSVHLNCGSCGRHLAGAVGWFCQKCKSQQSSICCVCGLVVRGFYAFCQGCNHGGHIEHIKSYFKQRLKCPTCGHLCEYN